MAIDTLTKLCATCGQVFSKKPCDSSKYWPKKKYCSRNCGPTFKKGNPGPWLGKKRPQITGKNHYLWNGRTPIVEQIRKCIEYRQWRSDVFTRDDFTCQECGVRGGKLHVDHIKQFAFIVAENQIITMQQAVECSELWNLNNGRTLCVSCHRSVPVYSYGGTREIVFAKKPNLTSTARASQCTAVVAVVEPLAVFMSNNFN